MLDMRDERRQGEMSDQEYARKLAELDQLLNDPDVPMDPARIWALLAEVSGHDRASDLVAARTYSSPDRARLLH